MYPASGASDDYAVTTGIPLAFTLEVSTNDTHGFKLPVSHINEVATETFAGLKEFGRYVADIWNKNWYQLLA